MDTQRWLRAGDIFDRIFAAPQAERAALLDRLCDNDPELKPIVASMLDAEEAPLTFEHADDAAVLGGRIQAATTDVPPGGEAEPAPERVGPWRLKEKIGDGGMGVVWLAERADGQFEQRAALKLIKRGMDSDAVLARFLRERQILARLQHPNIAHLLDGGIAEDGRPYFAMEYVEGVALLQYCHEQQLSVRQRIELFLEVCAAVEFAHQHQVVHRDLKPTNVLVTPGGEVKLLDFGIAKVLVDSANGEATLTQARRERPMTPAYAAPEQFSGGTITKATDIYALGCVLYQLLTDKYAYDFRNAKRPEDMRRIIEASDPTPPSRLRLTAPPVPPKRLRGDLDTIVLAALKHDPERRYPSVAAFAQDLRNYLAGNPIAARRDHVAYRTYKYFRRHRVGAAAAATVLLIFIAALLFELRARAPMAPPVPGSSMAIADFSNLSQDKHNDWIAAALGNELATELTSSSVMHALPGELVSAARAGLPAPSAGGYGPASLRTLHKRLGADYVLSGSYLVSGPADAPSLRLDVAVQDARNDAPIASITQSGPLNELPQLVEQAGAELRAKLGLPRSSAATLEQVARAQPPTLDIAQHMGIALNALQRSEPARARDELLKIVATTPGYAPAYLHLAQAWKAMGYDAKALANAQQAAAHSEGLPEVQRVSIAREVAVEKSDWVHAVELSRKLLALDPQNPERHFDLFSDLLNADKVDDAQAVLDALRKLPGSQGDPRVELKAVALAERRGDIPGELRHAGLALHLAQARDAPGLAANAMFDLALAHLASQQYAQAEQEIRDAIEVNKRNANPQFEADSRVMLAILQEQTHPQAARDEYQNALGIYQRIGDRHGIATVYSNLSRTLWLMGDRDAVETALRQLSQINADIGDSRSEAWTQNSLVNLKIDAAADDDAVAAAKHALETSKRAGTPIDQVIALRNLAELMRLRGQLGKAQVYCKQVRAEAEKANSPQGYILAEYVCASIALDAGNVAAATSGFEQLYQRAAVTGDVETAAITAYQLARIDAAGGRWPQARDRLLAAIEKLHALDAAYYETGAQALLALCYAALDQPAKRDAAARRARELRSRVTFHLDLFGADVALASLDTAGKGNATARLLALATLAQNKRWVPEAFEARLAALRTLRAAHSPETDTMQHEIEAAARSSGFNWVAARASSQPMPVAHAQR